MSEDYGGFLGCVGTRVRVWVLRIGGMRALRALRRG